MLWRSHFSSLSITFEAPRAPEKWLLTHILIPMHTKIRISFAGLREVAKRVVGEVAKELKNLLVSESQSISFESFPKISFSTKIERSTRYIEKLICEGSGMSDNDLQDLISNTALSRYVGTIFLESEAIGKLEVLVDTTSTINNINFLAVVVRNPGKYSSEIATVLRKSCRCDVRA